MSTPSFIDRLRSRSRRPGQGALLDPALLPVLETSPGPLPDLAVRTELPEDHWHAGDPRLAEGATVLGAGDLPHPRRPVDRRGLHLVPDVDLRGEVVDLRGAAPAAPAARAEAVAPEREAPCTEPSTWLG
ncbi:hypothetical protein FHN55_14195 [Streptomyces sp. NP160]|uniref:hypothetical protein n=1 Tax=Streptomyces sp. NP160 TaxID=2586637 RepID=UPI001118668C|nr:hypothetical protein [Streptomyces sp. NP160]TNM64308.1 hypothetical protein FHN55_14195 [Streptomyces sp. NP160]